MIVSDINLDYSEEILFHLADLIDCYSKKQSCKNHKSMYKCLDLLNEANYDFQNVPIHKSKCKEKYSEALDIMKENIQLW